MFDNEVYDLFAAWTSSVPFIVGSSAIAVTSENPILVNWQDDVLHCDNGPSVQFSDGWSIWSLNGVRVNEQIVMDPQSQSIEEIRGESNEEVKRIRIERFGWQRYLDAVGATVIESRRNDIEQTTEALMSGDDMRVLICACPSTARVYGMEVPTEIETCEQAQSWMRNETKGFCIGAS